MLASVGLKFCCLQNIERLSILSKRKAHVRTMPYRWWRIYSVLAVKINILYSSFAKLCLAQYTYIRYDSKETQLISSARDCDKSSHEKLAIPSGPHGFLPVSMRRVF